MIKVELGLLTILTLIFLILKLTEVINWSWWVVLLPMYLIPVIIVSTVFIIVIYSFIKEKLK
jgi:hypothetical protein